MRHNSIYCALEKKAKYDSRKIKYIVQNYLKKEIKRDLESEYYKQASDFLEKNGIKFEIIKVGIENSGIESLKDRKINTFNIKLTRADRSEIFKFHDSVNSYEKMELAESYYRAGIKDLYPRPYVLLAGLTKCEVGSFHQFCNDYGYDSEYRKTLEIYLAVGEEYFKVCRIFYGLLEELQEIN